MTLKNQLSEDMKSAMRARDKERLGVIRLIQTEIKQREIDNGVSFDDQGIYALIEKMVKKRRDAEQQYRDAGRKDLADSEAVEVAVLENYLPTQLSDDEIEAAIERVINDQQASSMKDMGAVMGTLKAQLRGQADLGDVSQRVKRRLAG